MMTYTQLLSRVKELEARVANEGPVVSAARRLAEAVRPVVGTRTVDDPAEIDAVHTALEDLEDAIRPPRT